MIKKKMKLIIIRHGDPDYEHDTITGQGHKEAELLSRKMIKNPADYYYVSPLGRARDTAAYTMNKLGREVVVLDWLCEFGAPIHRPDRPEQLSVTWDWLPGDWTKDEKFFSDKEWYENEIMRCGNVKEKYDAICEKFDELLAKHGYVRDGRLYRTEEGNNDTVVLFCHFGLECVLLSHLLNISPMLLWHGFCAAPTSVTTLATEERRKGIVYFRMLSFGDTSHLYAGDTEPTFAARFVEKHGNEGDRVD